jgi:glycosyltransferase involved in cell wall biosynthesis
LPALYAKAVALVFPSRYEGFGLPVAEAMSCGCPVITANNSSLGEIAKGYAVLIENADDPAELAGAMQRVFADESLAATLRANGKLRAADFSWSRAADQHLEIYKGLVGAPRSRSRRSSYRPLLSDARKASASFISDRRMSAGQSPNRRRT